MAVVERTALLTVKRWWWARGADYRGYICNTDRHDRQAHGSSPNTRLNLSRHRPCVWHSSRALSSRMSVSWARLLQESPPEPAPQSFSRQLQGGGG
jgi:hypothetical protein